MNGRAFTPLYVGVLTVSDTRTESTDRSGALLVERLEGAGHEVRARSIVTDEIDAIRTCLREWIDRSDVEVILTTGGTGLAPRDVTPEALAPLITRTIPGFGEMFRRISETEIGTSTMQSRCEAACCKDSFVFMLPGSPNACATAMDHIVLEQLDTRHRPCSIAELVPRVVRASAP